MRFRNLISAFSKDRIVILSTHIVSDVEFIAENINALRSAVFFRFSDLEGNWNGRTVSDMFGTEEIRIGYTYGWLMTSQNSVKVFLVLALAAIVIISPVFSGEYSGMDNVILTSRYGRTKCAQAKVAAGYLIVLTVTAEIAALHFIVALALYGSGGLGCSILFTPIGFAEGYIPFNITCGTLLGYRTLLAFTGIASVTGITFALSARISCTYAFCLEQKLFWAISFCIIKSQKRR